MIKYTSYSLILLVLFSSCASVLSKTATPISNSYRDTISFFKGRYGHIVIPAKVDGVPRKLTFDSGASGCFLPENSIKKSNKKCFVRDIHGKITRNNLGEIDCLWISKTGYKNAYAVPHTFPAINEIEGLIGFNIIKASNWQISSKMIVVSHQPFFIQPKVILPFVERSNILKLKISLNKTLNNYIIDYGGDYDLELSEKFYNKYKTSFPSSSIKKSIQKSYGLNGSKDQKVQQLNCDINFEGLQIQNVNVTVRKGIPNRLGMTFLNRFKNIAINSTNKEMCFSELN